MLDIEKTTTNFMLDEEFTPDKARNALELNNYEYQRKLRPGHVHELKQSIINGNFTCGEK